MVSRMTHMRVRVCVCVCVCVCVYVCVCAQQPTPVLLPGESPWTEESGGLQSMGLRSQTQLKRLNTAQ